MRTARFSAILFLLCFLFPPGGRAVAAQRGNSEPQTPATATQGEAEKSSSGDALVQPAEAGASAPVSEPAAEARNDQSLSQPSTFPLPTGQPSVSFFDLIVRPMGGTLLICALAIGTLVLYRKYNRRGAAAGAPIASVLLTLPLGDKRSVALVKLGRQVLVLGNTPQSISFLGQFDEQGLMEANDGAVRDPEVPEVEVAAASEKTDSDLSVHLSGQHDKLKFVGRSERTNPNFSVHLKQELENAERAEAAAGTPRFDHIRQSLFGL